MSVWRWDQGRLIYFAFPNIMRIARSLATLDGQTIERVEVDPLRPVLTADTGLPFLPERYTVWRNYKRVFESMLLATRIGPRLVTTNLCRELSAPDCAISPDDYFVNFAQRWYYDSPVFDGYTNKGLQVFPICALLKYLLSQHSAGRVAQISLNDVFRLIIANDMNGTEPQERYNNLLSRDTTIDEVQFRQVRELLIFVSQASFLKWHNNHLLLDIALHDVAAYEQLVHIAVPIILPRKADRGEEILQLGDRIDRARTIVGLVRENADDVSFEEGKRIRSTHLRYERSPKLRELFLRRQENPTFCDMCSCDTGARYPWTNGLIEVHHLLPLASPIRVTNTGTSLDDLVPVCPTCHKSVHQFYKQWFVRENVEDFRSVEEAREVYVNAKNEIRI